MKTAAILLALGALLTVEQRDSYRSSHDPPSSAVSADGRFVAFTTYSQLVPADADHSSDVYVLDRARQQVTLESPDTVDYPGDSSHPGISGDGRFIIFERANAVVLHDRAEDVTTILGEGHQPVIAENGRVAFFAAAGFDRAAGADVNGQNSDIYSVDLVERSGAARQRRDAGTGRADWRRASTRARAAMADMSHSPRGGRRPAGAGSRRSSSCAIPRFMSPGWSALDGVLR